MFGNSCENLALSLPHKTWKEAQTFGQLIAITSILPAGMSQSLSGTLPKRGSNSSSPALPKPDLSVSGSRWSEQEDSSLQKKSRHSRAGSLILSIFLCSEPDTRCWAMDCPYILFHKTFCTNLMPIIFCHKHDLMHGYIYSVDHFLNITTRD